MAGCGVVIAEATVAKDLVIKAVGYTRLELQGNVDVARHVKVTNKDEFDVSIESCDIGGNLSVKGRGNDSSIALIGTSIGKSVKVSFNGEFANFDTEVVTIGKSVKVKNTGSPTATVIDSTMITKTLSVKTGDGADTVRVETSTVGKMSVKQGDGDDAFTSTGSTYTKKSSTDGGAGAADAFTGPESDPNLVFKKYEVVN